MTQRKLERLSETVPEPHIIPSRNLLWYLTNRWLDDPRWQPHWRALVHAMVAIKRPPSWPGGSPQRLLPRLLEEIFEQQPWRARDYLLRRRVVRQALQPFVDEALRAAAAEHAAGRPH